MATPKTARIIVLVQWIVVVGAAIKAAVSLVRIIATSAPDFYYYYEAAGEVVRSVARPLHLLPPPSLLVFAPIALVPYELMEALWVLGSFFCLIGIVLLSAKQAGIAEKRTVFTVMALTYLSFPSQFTLGMGQVNLYALALIVAAVFLEKKQSRMFTGGLFAWAILIKPEVVLLLAVLLGYRRWADLFAIGAWLISTIGVSVVVYGIDTYARYGERMLNAAGTWKDYGIYYNQGLTGLLARAGTTDATWYAVTAILIIAVTVMAFRKKHIPFPDALWLSIPVFLLVEPIAWQHHFVFLIPTYFTLWRREKRRLFRGLIAASYALISMNIASPGFLTSMPYGWLPASHGTIGAIILWLVTIL
jgi:hypothetical protein